MDKVRPGGAGTSNDGNTARRFFQNVEVSANITGLDVTVLHRCATILRVLSSGYSINIESFEEYCLETARFLINKYPWYYLPVSVHKILIHSPRVLSQMMIPIGQLSEEAQESRNKNLKEYREYHTRKTSRQHTNEDLLHMLLVSSDPFISSLRRGDKLKMDHVDEFPAEMLNLLDIDRQN